MDLNDNLSKDYRYCSEKFPTQNSNFSIQAKTYLDDLFS